MIDPTIDHPNPIDPPHEPAAPPTQSPVPQGDPQVEDAAPPSQPIESTQVKAPEAAPIEITPEVIPEPVDPRSARTYMKRAFSILHDNGRIEGTYYSAGGGGAVDIEGLYHGQRFDSTDALFRLALFTPDQRESFLRRMKSFLSQPDRFTR